MKSSTEGYGLGWSAWLDWLDEGIGGVTARDETERERSGSGCGCGGTGA
jgi:hypothetical protein